MLTAIWMVNFWLAGMVAPFGGLTNFDEGMLSTLGMTPMGDGLHEPVTICFPFVMGRLGTVRQKLIKLLLEVSEAT